MNRTRQAVLRTAAAPLLALLALGAPASSQTSGFAPPGASGSGVNSEPLNRLPKGLPQGGADLPNGWRVTPAGKAIATLGDLVTNLAVSPDGKVVVALNSGFLTHALTVFDAKTHAQLQKIELKASFLGLAWSPDGRTLFVSGGNATWEPDAHTKSYADNATADEGVGRASIYAFTYAEGRLSEKPAGLFSETLDPKQVWWSGVASLPARHKLYAANLGTGTGASAVTVFDADSRKIITRIPVEISPYQTVLSADGERLFVSNWSSASVSVIDTQSDKVVATLHVGKNPNDMKLSADGRLFVACADDNSVYVIDSRMLEVTERLSTTLTPLAPEGSTPNALAIDDARKRLYVANADNNSLAVARIDNRAHSTVIGFIPTGWYPSALLLTDHGKTLYIGNAKGEQGHPDPKGPHSTPALKYQYSFEALMRAGGCSVHCVQTSSLQILPVTDLGNQLARWTRQVMENTPYRDSLLSEARPSRTPSVIPQRVGEGSPIKHVIYIIKENRTYDQVFGDLQGSNGDPSLTLFGETITPNQHALAREYMILDNLYCDGEVSMDGHLWSTAAYATDFNEKTWPPQYADRSSADVNVRAMIPGAGFLWDLAQRKGLTYRSYGELATAFTPTSTPEGVLGAEALIGHFADPRGFGPEGDAGIDTEKMKAFLAEFRQYEANYDSADPNKRLPNFIVMHLGNDHTQGTKPGERTPEAMVADNDYALGQLVEAVSHSRYWPNTAIFVIEDDAQDGADHVDARRTIGLVISPYVKRGIVDSTLYTTSSMLRSMELLLGLPPMSQYDAAAMPMYSSFGVTPVSTPFDVIKPKVDITAKNSSLAYGAAESAKMDFAGDDRAPMHRLNEIIWKSVRGADSPMPAPVHRFRPIVDHAEAKDGDRD
jgi:YVTN family beta-propeller protein